MPRRVNCTHTQDEHQALVLARIEVVNSGCWQWMGTIDGFGYGKFSHRVGDKTCTFGAHRLAYEAFVVPIPKGLQIDHLCRNRGCVNPAHLEPVSQAENHARGQAVTRLNALRTSCVHGHQFDEANTRKRNRRRDCRACDARRQREMKARRATKVPA